MPSHVILNIKYSNLHNWSATILNCSKSLPRYSVAPGVHRSLHKLQLFKTIFVTTFWEVPGGF